MLARDAEVRRAIGASEAMVDATLMHRLWDKALAAPAWTALPVWLHGDLHPGNLLVRKGRVAAVIDFGCLGVGDPACDMLPAWTILDAPSRATFRDSVDVDDATWTRGIGWALSIALIALPYYRDSNPVLAGMAQRTIEAITAA